MIKKTMKVAKATSLNLRVLRDKQEERRIRNENIKKKKKMKRKTKK